MFSSFPPRPLHVLCLTPNPVARFSEACRKILPFLGCLTSSFLGASASPSVLSLPIQSYCSGTGAYAHPATCLLFQLFETGHQYLSLDSSFSVPTSGRQPQSKCYYITDPLCQLVVRCVWEGDFKEERVFSTPVRTWKLREDVSHCRFWSPVDGRWDYSYAHFWRLHISFWFF